MPTFLKKFAIIAFAIVFCSLKPFVADAGLLDKINAAAQAINTNTQNSKKAGPNKTAEDPDRPLHLEDHDKTGSCEGKRSATCMDYMELVDNCMDPLKGYRMKLTGDLIEKKLKTEKLTDRQRKNLEEDLFGIREAEKNKSDNPTIAGKVNSQRYLSDISEEDQICINADYGIQYKKIYNKCMGADHMGIGKRTEMMQDVETMTCEQAIAKHRAEKSKEEEPFNCMKGVTTLRFKIMADMMEAKMNSQNLSAKDRTDWEADIASIRELPETGQMMPKAVDPNNPARAMMRLTTDDQMKLNEEYMKQSQAMMAECNQKQKANEPSQRLDPNANTTSKMKALQEAKAKEPPKKKRTSGGGGSLSASLGATNLDYFERAGVVECFDPIKGHMAKVTADKLEAKLKASPNVTGQKRKEWEEDIAAWREAAKYKADQPDPPDPDNPYRWQDYLTREERQQINGEHSAFVNKITKECNSVNPMK